MTKIEQRKQLLDINNPLEKMVHERYYDFLQKCKCLYKYQFGFRRCCSTNHALVEMKTRKALDSHKFACGIFVDLQKAIVKLSSKIRILWSV